MPAADILSTAESAAEMQRDHGSQTKDRHYSNDPLGQSVPFLLGLQIQESLAWWCMC